VDAKDPGAVTPDGRLPEADLGDTKKTATGLREVFGRMGFSDREIVALAGAHALGYCHENVSGYVGAWTPTPNKFNNLYFALLLNLNWEPNLEHGKLQYSVASENGRKDGKALFWKENTSDASIKLMMLPSDIALLKDDKFRPWVINVFCQFFFGAP
jgi:cytochrome c peroxidase